MTRNKRDEPGGNFPGLYHEKTAGKTGRPFMFECNTDVKVGGWFNAAKAQLHFGAAGTGEVTGAASAFNCELYLPNKTMAGGSYAALEVNLDFQASTVTHGNPAYPTALVKLKVNGTQTQIDAWEAAGDACIFQIDGLTAANDEVFDAQGGGTHTDSLRILINGSPYWIMLTDNPGA